MSLWCSTSRSLVVLPGELASDEPAPAEPAAACACSSWPVSSLTRYSRFRNLSMTLATPGSRSCGAGGFDAAGLLLVSRSRRRAHLGGRAVDGKTQAIFAWRHLEQGDCLSQRTLRVRHTRQLRNFGGRAGADNGILVEAGEDAFFSEHEAEGSALASCDEVATGPVPADILRILQQSIDRRGYYLSRLVVTLSSLLTPALR